MKWQFQILDKALRHAIPLPQELDVQRYNFRPVVFADGHFRFGEVVHGKLAARSIGINLKSV